MIQYFLYKIGMRLSVNLPLKVAYKIAALVAFLQYKFCRKDTEAVLANLRIITGSSDVERLEPIARAVFINFAKYLVDFFRFSMIDEAYIKKFIKIEGREYLNEAFKKGNGVIALTAHIGNWELAGIVTALLGYPVNAVALSHKDPRINELFIKQRQDKGVKVIPVGIAVIRKCFTALKNNELIGLLGDRDFTHGGFNVEFLGKIVRMPKGPAIFCLKAHSIVVPTFMVREEDDSYRLIYLEPITYSDTGNSEEDLMIVTKKIVTVIEDIIRRYPEQWFMFRRFWDEDANRI